MDFVVDKENRRVKVVREFAAPLSKVWAAWTQRNCWMSGGLQDHGKQKQKQWILKMAGTGFTQCLVRKAKNIFAVQITNRLFR